MKWIKYQIICGKNENNENILVTKEIGYNEANLAIAKTEAYNGKYTIEEGGEDFDKEPIPIELGGTGASDVITARKNLGLTAAYNACLGYDISKGTIEGRFGQTMRVVSFDEETGELVTESGNTNSESGSESGGESDGSSSAIILINADYEQNDPTQPDYIKNRPFYAEVATDYEPLLTSTTFTFQKVSEGTLSNGALSYMLTIPYDKYFHSVLTSDLKYIKIVWDGTEYICEPIYKGEFISIGNIGVGTGEGEDTGEPFYITYNYVQKGSIVITDLSTFEDVGTIDHNISVSVLRETIKKLDSKFLDFTAIDARIENYINEALGGEY